MSDYWRAIAHSQRRLRPPSDFFTFLAQFYFKSHLADQEMIAGAELKGEANFTDLESAVWDLDRIRRQSTAPHSVLYLSRLLPGRNVYREATCCTLQTHGPPCVHCLCLA